MHVVRMDYAERFTQLNAVCFFLIAAIMLVSPQTILGGDGIQFDTFPIAGTALLYPCVSAVGFARSSLCARASFGALPSFMPHVALVYLSNYPCNYTDSRSVAGSDLTSVPEQVGLLLYANRTSGSARVLCGHCTEYRMGLMDAGHTTSRHHDRTRAGCVLE